ncbi:PepSY-associated TM helix domain-containing protein [Geovibrio thiophilus]|nr:PepSY-associated TM helix domain-containing protein [Geovibrio thiophilus]
MKETFRKSIGRLHTWSGLLTGWLLFVIFFTGTYSYFKDEITYWMHPETHKAVLDAADKAFQAEMALKYLEANLPDAAEWSIIFADKRSPVLQVGHRERLPMDMKQVDYVRTAMPMRYLDPLTGEYLGARDTEGGNFLYRFHIELYGLDRAMGRRIVGIATMFMFIAIISGVVIHKRIFKDFFMFRRKKGLRSWLDAHIFTSVLALPYHLMITYSGLVLVMIYILPFNSHKTAKAFEDHIAMHMRQEQIPLPDEKTPLPDIRTILADAEERLGREAGSISVSNPYSGNTLVTVSPGTGLDIVNGFKGTGSAERLTYKGSKGRFMGMMNMQASDGVAKTAGVLTSLHLARFADTFLRWLFFVSGVLGTVMIGTGLIIWVNKKSAAMKKSFGRKLVEVLNVGGITGLVTATGVHFWANRLLPANLASRAQWEIYVFFAAWFLLFLHPVLRTPKNAWREQLFFSASLYCLMPVLNAFTSEVNLFSAVSGGNAIIMGFDLTVFGLGLLFGYAGWKLTEKRNVPDGALSGVPVGRGN